MSSEAFAALMTALDPPLIVLTTVAEDQRAGCLVGFHAQSSIDPQHYCIWVSKANHTYRIGLRARHFGVHFLTTGDLALAERFGTLTGDEVDKFAGLPLEDDPDGVPLLRDCPNRLHAERLALLDDGSDHVCLTTAVRRAEYAGPFEPLRISQVRHLTPGHESEERAIHP